MLKISNDNIIIRILTNLGNQIRKNILTGELVLININREYENMKYALLSYTE